VDQQTESVRRRTERQSFGTTNTRQNVSCHSETKISIYFFFSAELQRIRKEEERQTLVVGTSERRGS